MNSYCDRDAILAAIYDHAATPDIMVAECYGKRRNNITLGDRQAGITTKEINVKTSFKEEAAYLISYNLKRMAKLYIEQKLNNMNTLMSFTILKYIHLA